MALATRGDFYGVEVGVETKQLANTSRLVSNMTGYEVPPNKAIVGRNAFLHESGIHQDGVLKDRRTFEIMTKEDIGLEGTNIFLGKHSGRHALKDALEELGYFVEGEVLKRAFVRFKEIADHKKTVTAADLEAIAADEVGSFEGKYVLDSFRVVAATGRQSRAAVTISPRRAGHVRGRGRGRGPRGRRLPRRGRRHEHQGAPDGLPHRRRHGRQGRPRRGAGLRRVRGQRVRRARGSTRTSSRRRPGPTCGRRTCTPPGG